MLIASTGYFCCSTPDAASSPRCFHGCPDPTAALPATLRPSATPAAAAAPSPNHPARDITAGARRSHPTKRTGRSPQRAPGTRPTPLRHPSSYRRVPVRTASRSGPVVLMAVDDTAKNRTQQVKGKAKEQVGKATGNKKLERSGQADMAKGEVKERASKIKDAFS
ncbi:hypothetical protein GCM10023201_17040 [Actinomycetospora corticicola]